MSNDPAEKRQAFQRWVSSLQAGAGVSSAVLGEESGVTSLDEQATLVRHLPKDVVRQLREREAGRLTVDPDSTAIFQPPPELLARARRLVPPQKPERSVPSSAPEEPTTQPLSTLVVVPPTAAETAALAEVAEPALPDLADAVEADDPPSTPFVSGATEEPPAELAPPAERATRFDGVATVIGFALLAAATWAVLTHWDWMLQALPAAVQSGRAP